MQFSKLLLEYLHSVGIKRIFGVVGREAEAIYFNEVPGIDFILTRHEMTAGVAALAISRFTQKPEVCFGTLGPGITHFMTALATANLDKYPLILIVAQIERSSKYYNNAHQCLDTISIVKPICKYAKEIEKPEEIKKSLETAIKLSMTKPYGPSVLSIPIDILSSDVSKEIKTLGTKLDKTILLGQTEKKKINSSELKKIINLIKHSSKNLIVIGDAVVKTKGIPDLIRKISKNAKIPVISTYSAKGVMPLDNKLNYGVINSYINVLTECKALETIFNDVDNIILIGYDLSEHYPFAWTRGKNKKIININSYVNTGFSIKPDISIIGDLSDNLKYFQQHLKYKQPSETSNITIIKKQITKIMQNDVHHSAGILLPNILNVLNNHFKNNYILANDIGMHRHISSVFFNANKAEDFVTSSGLSSFGTGLPLGIGAKIANPKRNVVVISGDGGFHSSSGDLETIIRLKLKMLIIVVNSTSNSLIERYQLTGKYRLSNQKLTSFGKVDFVKLAQANGCPAAKAKNINDFKKLVKSFDSLNSPLLIEVPIYYPDLYINKFAKINEIVDEAKK